MSFRFPFPFPFPDPRPGRARGGATIRDPDAESGAITAFVAVFAVVLLVVVGLAVDAGRAIAAQRQAADLAEEAARAGAGQLSVDELRAGRIVIDGPSAIAAAEHYLTISGHPGTASVRGDDVTAHVVIVVPTTILGLVRIKSISVSASESATDVAAVNG